MHPASILRRRAEGLYADVGGTVKCVFCAESSTLAHVSRYTSLPLSLALGYEGLQLLQLLLLSERATAAGLKEKKKRKGSLCKAR